MTETDVLAPSKGKTQILKAIAEYNAECEKDFEDVQERAKDRFYQACGGPPYTHIHNIGRKKKGGEE